MKKKCRYKCAPKSWWWEKEASTSSHEVHSGLMCKASGGFAAGPKSAWWLCSQTCPGGLHSSSPPAHLPWGNHSLIITILLCIFIHIIWRVYLYTLYNMNMCLPTSHLRTDFVPTFIYIYLIYDYVTRNPAGFFSFLEGRCGLFTIGKCFIDELSPETRKTIYPLPATPCLSGVSHCSSWRRGIIASWGSSAQVFPLIM